MRLQYAIAATGENQLRSVFRGIEREAQASNRRMAGDAQRTAQRSAKAAASPLTGGKVAAAQVKESERRLADAERKRLRDAVAASRQEQRARLEHERTLHRARESLDRQRSRGLMAQFNAQERAERRVVATRQATLRSFGRGAATSVGRGVGTVARLGGAAAGIAGGLAIGSALAEETAIRRKASVIANKAGDPSMKGVLASESTQIRGFSGSESLDALDAFIGKTGDLNAGRAALKEIGALALATDAEFTTMGEAAGNAFNVIADSIKDPKKRVEELNKVMRGWAGQGNIGAVEIADMAQFGGRLGGATRKFAGNPSDLLLSMGAMSQAAVRAGGASDAAEATTGVARFAADLTKKPAQKALAGLGVNVFADKGKTKLRDPAEVIADILEKTKGNLSLGEEIMNAESGKVLGGFSQLYIDAEAKKKGSGKGAVLGEFQRYKDAGMTTAGVAASVESRMEEPDKQFSEAMKDFNHAIGSQLLPAVTKAIPAFTQLVPVVSQAAGMLGSFIGWFAENPFTGLGAIVLGSVAKDLATAGIGQAVQSTLVSMLAQTSMGGGLPVGAAGGLAGKLGAIGLAAGGVALAADQANSFGKENGGWGGAASFLGIGEGDGWGFAGVDSYMNKRAKAAALTPGTVNIDGGARTVGGGTTPQQTSSVAAPPTGAASANTSAKAAADMQRAVQQFGAIVSKMPTGGGAGTPANRTAPIVSPSRG